MHKLAYAVTDTYPMYAYSHRHALHRHMDPLIRHRPSLRHIDQ